MLRNRLRSDLYACGTTGLPKTVFAADRQWVLIRTFKHDFFAATGLYEMLGSSSQNVIPLERAVLKISRVQPFLGVPLAWIGRYLKNHEYRILTQLQSLDQVPQLIDEYGRNAFMYRYIDGHSLDETPNLPDAFFDDLKSLLHKIHRKKICYVDMNKRGNILIGNDNRPYMIDFQISTRLHWRWSSPLRKMLQGEDHYHLLKHKRRLRPDLMSESEKALSRHRSLPIRIHRFLTVPLRTLRRQLLGLLYRKKVLIPDETLDPTPENDPSRFI